MAFPRSHAGSGVAPRQRGRLADLARSSPCAAVGLDGSETGFLGGLPPLVFNLSILPAPPSTHRGPAMSSPLGCDCRQESGRATGQRSAVWWVRDGGPTQTRRLERRRSKPGKREERGGRGSCRAGGKGPGPSLEGPSGPEGEEKASEEQSPRRLAGKAPVGPPHPTWSPPAFVPSAGEPPLCLCLGGSEEVRFAIQKVR